MAEVVEPLLIVRLYGLAPFTIETLSVADWPSQILDVPLSVTVGLMVKLAVLGTTLP